MGEPDLSAFRFAAVRESFISEIPPRTHRDNAGRWRVELLLECGHTVTVDYRYVLSDSGASRGRARAQAVALTIEKSFRCPACPS